MLAASGSVEALMTLLSRAPETPDVPSKSERNNTISILSDFSANRIAANTDRSFSAYNMVGIILVTSCPKTHNDIIMKVYVIKLPIGMRHSRFSLRKEKLEI